MPHFICRWPGGDVLLASVDSRQELDTILQERCEPGVCKVARYHGPLVLELKSDVPGVSRASAERFRPGPACPGFQPAWECRASSGDVELLAGDGSIQRVHKLVLQCRLPVLQGQPIAADIRQVRLSCVPDGPCLHSLVHFLYLDYVQQQADLTPQLHVTALACGLQRLVDLCEAHFAAQLELQLLTWQGLCEAQREGVMDSFIGWTLYSEQLDRQELRQLCVHALARHVTAAQSRPLWSSLSETSSSLVQLIAASTAPPLVHRQLVPDGSAVLPVPSNPAPPGANMGALGPVVSVDAEAFAAAGGRLTSTEWQQLQKFRSAVLGSLQAHEASPIVVDQQQLSSSSLSAAANPYVAFSVKQPVLGPHKRLMDSVCRFAFPATHSLLGSGWQLAAAGGAAAQAAAAAPAAAPAAQAAPTNAAGAAPGTTPQQAAAAAAAPAPVAERANAVEGPGASGDWHVPVPVPAVQPIDVAIPAAVPAELPRGLVHPGLAAAAAALIAEELAEPSSSSTQHPLSNHAGTLVAESSIRTSGTSSSPQAAAAGASQAVNPSGSPSAVGRYLRSRMSGGSPGRRSSHGRLRSELRPQPSWGSGVSLAGAEAQAALQQALEQQQQQQQAAVPAGLAMHSAALPLQRLRLLQEEEQSGSWGSGTISRQASLPPALQLPASALELEAGQQQHSQQQQQSVVSQMSQLSQVELERMLAHRQQNQQQGEANLEYSEVDTVDELGTAIAGIVQQQQQQQQQHLLGEAAGELLAQGGLARHSTGLLELPVFKMPYASNLGRSDHAAASAEGALPGANNGAGIGFTAGAAGGAAAAVRAAVAAGGANRLDPLGALQRSLVEDFVLYEEASAARQHVVGILVSIEQGDVAAGQRLLAPACAELIAATAPAAVPNRLAALAAVPAAGAAAANEAAVTAAAVRAAGEYLNSARGISKLLGMASSSRAALEPSPAQLQQQQQQMVRALQRIGSQLPGLSWLLSAHPLAAAAAGSAAAMAAAGIGSGGISADAAAMAQQGPEVVMQEAGAQQAAEAANPGSGDWDLATAIADLLQLPELAQCLQLPVLLTQEQFQQRQAQLQQLASQAAAVLGADAAGGSTPGSSSGAAAPTAAAAANPPAVPGDVARAPAAPSTAAGAEPAAAAAAAGAPRELQAGLLFSSILASLGAAVAASDEPGGDPLGTAAGAAGSYGRLMGRRAGVSNHVGSLPPSSAAAAAANWQHMQASGGVAAAAGQHAGSLGMLGHTGGAAVGMSMGSGAGASGMFTPTGVGALLAGGLLAEGGVAGDSILEDMAADLLHGAGGRRITCHGLYELCAALARPADAHGSPTHPTQQQAEAPEAAQIVAGSDSGNGSGPAGLSGHKRRLSSAAEEQSGPKR